MTNPLLDKTKSAILQKTDSRLHPIVQKMVTAGETIMYSDNTRHMLTAAIKQGKPELVGGSFAALAVLVIKQADKQMPMDALVPAAVILLCEGLQLMEDGGAPPIDNDYLSAAAQAMGEKLLSLLKATPDTLQRMVDKAGAAAKPAPPGTEVVENPAGIVAGAAPGAM